MSLWTVGNELVFEWALIIASILGAAPIAIQAYQALKVKSSVSTSSSRSQLPAFLLPELRRIGHRHLPLLFGAYLEQRTLNKTRSAIKELTEMAPESALKLMDDGEYVEVEVDEVEVGDVLLVKTGAKVPVDGTVLSGEGSINKRHYRRVHSVEEKESRFMPVPFWTMVLCKSSPTGWEKTPPSARSLN